MTAREHLYELIESLPEAELFPASRFLEYLRDRREDPVIRALERAPVDDEPLSDEEAEAIAEALEDRDHGRVMSGAEIRRDLLGES